MVEIGEGRRPATGAGMARPSGDRAPTARRPSSRCRASRPAERRRVPARRRAGRWARPGTCASASATVAASCRLPKRSTQVTSAAQADGDRRPAWRCSTTPPVSRTRDAGSTAVAEVTERDSPAHSAAAAGAKRSRPSKVRAATGGVGACSSTPRAIDAAADQFRRRRPAARCQGRRRRRAPAAGSVTSRQTPRRPDAHTRIDHRQHDAGSEIRHRPHQGMATRPDVERRDLVGQVDDGDARRRRYQDGVDHTDELVRCPEVGEEEDGLRRYYCGGSALRSTLQGARALRGRGHRLHEGGAHGTRPRARGPRLRWCPAGEVTSARRTAGSSPVSASSCGRARAWSRRPACGSPRGSRPICTPASMSASATRKK